MGNLNTKEPLRLDDPQDGSRKENNLQNDDRDREKCATCDSRKAPLTKIRGGLLCTACIKAIQSC